jgi:hypothetical protein
MTMNNTSGSTQKLGRKYKALIRSSEIQRIPHSPSLVATPSTAMIALAWYQRTTKPPRILPRKEKGSEDSLASSRIRLLVPKKSAKHTGRSRPG